MIRKFTPAEMEHSPYQTFMRQQDEYGVWMEGNRLMNTFSPPDTWGCFNGERLVAVLQITADSVDITSNIPTEIDMEELLLFLPVSTYELGGTKDVVLSIEEFLLQSDIHTAGHYTEKYLRYFLSKPPHCKSHFQTIDTFHAEPIFALLKQASMQSVRTLTFDLWYTSVMRLIRYQKAAHVTVVIDNEIVGIGLLNHVYDIGMINSIVVREDKRRLGIGRFISTELTKMALAKNLKPMLFAGNEHARNLYQALSYEITGDWMYYICAPKKGDET